MMCKFANKLGYSDVTPFEVIKKISDKTLVIRAMKYERDESVKLEFDVGGFAAHCVNQHEQKWFIESDPTRPEIRIRLGKKGWKDAHGSSYNLEDAPRRFYDYNF